MTRARWRRIGCPSSRAAIVVPEVGVAGGAGGTSEVGGFGVGVRLVTR